MGKLMKEQMNAINATLAQTITDIQTLRPTVEDLRYELTHLFGATDTASGSVASFSDGAGGVAVKDLKVIITSQGGSGYDQAKVFNDPIGGTIKWNQFVQTSAIPSTKTVKGVTFTNNGDGSFTTSGIASSTISGTDYLIIASTTLVSGHKYVLKGCPSGGSASTYYANDGYAHFDYGNGYLGTLSLPRFYVSIASGTNVTGLTWRPQLFDLTEMFGAGNEPTTVDEFKYLFPYAYYPYNSGEETCVSAVNGKRYYEATVDFPTTIYDGTLDVTNGVLVSGGQTYQLTPKDLYQFTLDNNISANCGSVEVTYRLNLNTAIERLQGV